MAGVFGLEPAAGDLAESPGDGLKPSLDRLSLPQSSFCQASVASLPHGGHVVAVLYTLQI